MGKMPVVRTGGQVPADMESLGAAHQVPGVAFAVDDGVVGPAEQGGVVDGGRSAVEPMAQMVGVRPGRGFGAAREAALPVAEP